MNALEKLCIIEKPLTKKYLRCQNFEHSLKCEGKAKEEIKNLIGEIKWQTKQQKLNNYSIEIGLWTDVQGNATK